jgi:ethanolamine utilization cobalamin adenosyltransferase
VIPPFPPGTRFSPAAQDFLKAHHIETRFEPSPPPASRPDWDRPGAFPVVLGGPAPVCIVCGQPLPHKPDHLTQLDTGHFAPKTAPRLKFRGRLDTLHAVTMLAAAEARRYHLPRLAAPLDTLAAYCREIQSAEYNARAVQPLAVAGKSEDEIHEISHWPDRHLGLAHLVPGADDHAILHWLNYARAMAREVEVAALEAYPPPERPDLARALNRLSSAVYYLELLFKSGKLSWNVSA